MTGFPNDDIERVKVQHRVTEPGDLGTEAEEVGGYEVFDMSARTAQRAHIVGRRNAQVEIIAALAVLFRETTAWGW